MESHLFKLLLSFKRRKYLIIIIGISHLYRPLHKMSMLISLELVVD